MLYGGTAVLFAGYAAPVSGGGGECVRRFGDRDDGHLLRSLSCIFAVSPYLMTVSYTHLTLPTICSV